MKSDYSVRREYNYTVSITDQKGVSIYFRDITGKDLEFLERTLQEDKEINIDDVIELLQRLCVSNIKIKSITPRVIKDLFKIVSKEILCNFMPKIKFLEVCYFLQNNSFVALDFFESQPMTKVMAMIQIHQSEIEKINKSRSQS